MARVLVVDDSPLFRLILCDYVRDLGHAPFAAATADEAFSLCEACDPDLIIKDLVMPDTDPAQFLQALHSLKPLRPIVICSTSGRRHEILEAIRAGAVDFLIKPFGRVEVANLLQRFFSHEQKSASQ